MDNKDNWDSLNPIDDLKNDTISSIDWSLEVYNSGDYMQTQSVTPDYSTMVFYKH